MWVQKQKFIWYIIIIIVTTIIQTFAARQKGFYKPVGGRLILPNSLSNFERRFYIFILPDTPMSLSPSLAIILYCVYKRRRIATII